MRLRQVNFALSALLLLVLVAAPAQAQNLPSPQAHFGHAMGADRTLVEWDDVVSYFQAVADADDRVLFSELGKSTEGEPFVMVTIADPATLDHLGRYREIQQQLADPRKTPPDEAEKLIAEGKTVVLITCSIHSTEVASTHTAIEFVYKLLSEDTSRHRAILKNTIFLLIPSLNPDGIGKVAQWYNRHLETPYEGAAMVELYHKYAGHDNNRDWYMFTQSETRLVIEKAHNAWRPQIVYDVHQMGRTGARMFVPPWVDPIDPNIDPLIIQQVNQLGMTMAADLTAAGKTGVVVNGIYDYFTPSRHYQSYHGGLRLLSEAAGVRYATPVTVPFSSLNSSARGYNARKRSWNFTEPWPGGKWTLRDIVGYQLVTFESVLYNAAVHREELLRNFYRIGQRVIARHKDDAFVVPHQQHDPSAMIRMLRTLAFGDVEIERAQQDFRAAGRGFQEGDYVIRLAQPYGAFANTLLEDQDYPGRLQYAGGPPERPYDVTAHSLPLLMGVEVVPIGEPFEADLRPVATLELPPGEVATASFVELAPSATRAWTALNRLLKAGAEVRRNPASGGFIIRRNSESAPLLAELAAEFGLSFPAADAAPPGGEPLRSPRIGLYRGHVPIMDEGWTRWVLEDYEFPYRSVGNARLKRGGLNADFDVIVLPDAEPRTLHAGYLEGALYESAEMPVEFTGGIEDEGAAALRRFVRQGGTLLALNRASQYAIDRLKAPAGNVLKGLSRDQFYSPGALLNVAVDTSHPLSYGLRPVEAVWFQSGPAFEAPVGGVGASASEVLRYPRRDLLASGWLLGERYLSDHAAVLDITIGGGHLILFGIRPQYRAQSNAMFKMFFNSLYYH